MVNERLAMDMDNQSEEGEIRRSPGKSYSDDEDFDTADSLEIKPPQAVVYKKSSSSRKDKYKDKYRDSRHHEDRYKEKHRDNRYQRRHEVDPYDKSRRSDPNKRERDTSRYERKERSAGDHIVSDLRERLMDKRRDRHDDTREYKSSSSSSRIREESSSRREEHHRDHRREISRMIDEQRNGKHVSSRHVEPNVIYIDDSEQSHQLQQHRHHRHHHSSSHDKRHKRSHKHDRMREREKLDKDVTREGHRERRSKNQRQHQPMEVEYEEDVERMEIEQQRRHQHIPSKDPKDMTEQELRRQRLLDADREIALMKEKSRIELEARRMKRGDNKSESDDPQMDPSIVHLSEDSEATPAVESEISSPRSRLSDDNRRNRSSDETSNTSTSSTDDESTETRDSDSESNRSSPLSSDYPLKSDKSSEPSPKHSESNGVAKNEEIEKEKQKEEEELEDELPPYLPAINGCRNVEEYKCLNRIAEGTYGVVYRAEDKRTKEIVALKRLKMEKEKEGFPITSLREINTLLKAQHPNIVTVREIVVGSNMDKIFIVMDFVEHDLKSLMETMKQKGHVFLPGEVKCLMQQLLRAVAHLHDNWILHRDLKTSNLLLSHKGILKVGDFGLAREYGSPLKQYTSIVVTLWYRSPELLLGGKEYSTPIDVWSVGCIFAELIRMEALFPGKSEIDLLNRVFKELGTPNDKVWPGFSDLPLTKKIPFSHYPVNNLRQRFAPLGVVESGLELLNKFLTYDPAQRITADDALKHCYFSESPLPVDPGMIPTYPAKSEFGTRTQNASPKPPSGGKEFKQLGEDDDSSLGFHMGVREASRQAPIVGGGFHLKF